MEAALLFVGRYWKLFAVAALVAGGYVKGCSDEKERFDEHLALDKVLGEAQTKWSQRRTAQGKDITKGKDAENAEVHRKLDVALGHVGFFADELRKRPSGSIVPAVPSASEGGGTVAGDGGAICFGRDRLRDGIEGSLGRFGERFREIAKRGAAAVANFQTCATWALEQETAAKRDAAP